MGLANVISPGSKKVELWSGSKTSGTTITLSDSMDNYDFIAVQTVTNSESFVDLIAVPFLSGFATTTFSHFSSSTYQFTTPSYMCALGVTRVSGTGGTQLSITEPLYNNSNWKLGIVKVYGIRL